MTDTPNPGLFDAYAPAQIAHRIETVACAKASLGGVPTVMLAILAGAFIAFGAMFFTVTVTHADMGFGCSAVWRFAWD